MPLKTDINEYPLVLKLILAQLVVQYGSTDSFRQVAEDLDKHPLLQNLGGIRKMSATVSIVLGDVQVFVKRKRKQLAQSILTV